MTVRILDATTRAAVAAAPTQQEQCEAIRDAFAGDVTLRIEGAGGQHLRTVTLAPFTVNSETPRGLVCGAVLADTAVAPTTPGAAGITPTRWEFRNGSTPIFDTDEITQGVIKALCQPTFGAVVFTAVPTLPVDNLAPTQLLFDGMWTWFTEPRAVYYNGATYFGWVNSSGDIGISKRVHSTGAVTSFTLSAALEVNDHDNAAVHILPDGKIMAIYSKHNDTSGNRYRISANAEDISAWGSEQIVVYTPLPNTYSNPHYLSQTGKVYNFVRVAAGGSGTNSIIARAYSVSGGTWDTQRTWIEQTSKRPYVKAANNGTNRIDFLFTDQHPNQGASSIYHCYMQLDGSDNEVFYQSDGTLIGAGPVVPTTDATLVYDGSTNRGWVWDLVRESDGTLHAVWAVFVTSEDHRYYYAKCVAGAWTTPVEVTNAGVWLYAGEPYYSGGICIDATNPTRLYLSKKTPSVRVWELSEWRTTDGGATWAKHADITSGNSPDSINARPFSPRGHNGELPVLWWEASNYTSYTSYTARIMGLA